MQCEHLQLAQHDLRGVAAFQFLPCRIDLVGRVLCDIAGCGRVAPLSAALDGDCLTLPVQQWLPQERAQDSLQAFCALGCIGNVQLTGSGG